MNQVTTDRAYLSVIDIAVPRETKWEPRVVQQFTTTLFALPESFKLLIVATANRIIWSIELPHFLEQMVGKTIMSIYPQAQVNTVPKTGCHIGYWIYQLQGRTPFIGPLKYAEDFRDLDPLAMISGAMVDIESDEEIVYELTISNPKQNYLHLGDSLLTQSTVTWTEYTSVSGAMRASQAKARGADRIERYTSEISQMARDKISAVLKDTTLAIKVKAASQDRARHLVSLLFPALELFGREKFNWLDGPDSESYPLVLSAKEVAALWHLPSQYCQSAGIVWAKPTSVGLFQPPVAAQETDYVVLGESEYVGQPQSMYLTYDDRKTHVNIVGKTGSGKSTLIHSLVRQDILNGKCVGVIDPKGDLITRILATISPAQEEQVILFDGADKTHAIGLNLLAQPPNVPPDQIAGRVMALIKKFFADDWPGEQTERAFYAAILTLLYAPGSTVLDIPELFDNDAYRQRVLAQVDDLSALQFWKEYQRRASGDRQRIATPVVTRISRFHRDRTLQRIICQSKGLNFRWVIDSNKIFLASLAGLGELEAHTLGALLISKFQLAVMSRTDTPEQQRQPVYLYIDEVQNFATHSLGTMFSQGRAFGLSLATANQYFSQLPGETLEAVLGNVGTNICFAVGETSARHLAGLTRPEFTTEDLQQLDKYTAVVKMLREGQNLPAFLLHGLPPPVLPDDPGKIDRIRNHSRQTYGRPVNEVDAELRRRYAPGDLDEGSAAPVPTDPTKPSPPAPAAVLPPTGDIDLAAIWE